MLNYNIISVDVLSVNDVSQSLASKVRERRLEKNLTQERLARRADLKLPTYRKFERTGEISLNGLLKIAFALNMFDDFQTLFTKKQYASIEEVLEEGKNQRKRGKKK